MNELFDHVLAVCRDDGRGLRALARRVARSWHGRRGFRSRCADRGCRCRCVRAALARVSSHGSPRRSSRIRSVPAGQLLQRHPRAAATRCHRRGRKRVPHTFFRQRLLVFDRDALVVPPPDATPGPSQDRISSIIEEFFRDYGMFPVAVEREDWLLSVEAVHLIRSLLYQLFVEENAPLPMMGVKQWSAKLTGARAMCCSRFRRAGPTATSSSPRMYVSRSCSSPRRVRRSRARRVVAHRARGLHTGVSGAVEPADPRGVVASGSCDGGG